MRPFILSRMQTNERRLAGLSGIVFAVFLVAGFTLFGPKGGHYSAVALLAWPFLVALQWSPNQWLPAPFYLVVLWALVVGVRLLVSSPEMQ